MNEDELVRRLAQGDEHVFEAFVVAYKHRLRRVVLALGVRQADCDDVAQEVLVDAWRQLPAARFQTPVQFRAWLRRITHGKAIDYRRRMTSRRADLTIDVDSLAADATELAWPAEQESLIAVEQALASLPVNLQIVLRARYRHHRTVAQIAETLGRSQSWTLALIKRARDLFCDAVLHREKYAPPERLEVQAPDDEQISGRALPE